VYNNYIDSVAVLMRCMSECRHTDVFHCSHVCCDEPYWYGRVDIYVKNHYVVDEEMME